MTISATCVLCGEHLTSVDAVNNHTAAVCAVIQNNREAARATFTPFGHPLPQAQVLEFRRPTHHRPKFVNGRATWFGGNNPGAA